MFSNKTAKEKALDRAIKIFQYLNRSTTIAEWRKLALENYGFYDGTRQWKEKDRLDLESRNQPVITINKIKSRVDRLVGMEVQSRTRIGFRSHLAGNPEHQMIADALTKYALYSQEKLDMPKKDTWKFLDGLNTGIGWTNLYRDPFDNQINYEYINPFNVLWDIDDLSMDLSDMQYVCRLRWYPLELAKTIWHKNKKFFEGMSQDYDTDIYSDVSGELAARKSNYVDTYDTTKGAGNKALIIEVQYKQPKKSFAGISENGFTIDTFDEEEALRFIDSQNITEKDATQIIRVVFCGNELLEYEPLFPNIPTQDYFTYLPFINYRRYEDGIPEAWIEVLKDPQREINHRRAKLIASLNAQRIFVNPSVFPAATPAEIISRLQNNKINVVNGNIKENILIDNDSSLAPGQFNILEVSSRDFEDVGAMYSEMMGKETGIKTGIGIQSLQSAAAKSQTTKLDDFRYAKKKVGRQLLNLLQGRWSDILMSNILSPDDKQAFLSLAVTRNKKGEFEILNDIRSIPLDIYVEQSQDYESSFDENRATLQSILSAPNAALLLQSQKFLEILGLRNAQELAGEMQNIAKMSQPQNNIVPQETQANNGVSLPQEI